MGNLPDMPDPPENEPVNAAQNELSLNTDARSTLLSCFHNQGRISATYPNVLAKKTESIGEKPWLGVRLPTSKLAGKFWDRKTPCLWTHLLRFLDFESVEAIARNEEQRNRSRVW